MTSRTLHPSNVLPVIVPVVATHQFANRIPIHLLRVRTHFEKQNRNIHVTTANFNDVRLMSYYYSSLAKSASGHIRSKTLAPEPLLKTKGEEITEQKSERE